MASGIQPTLGAQYSRGRLPSCCWPHKEGSPGGLGAPPLTAGHPPKGPVSMCFTSNTWNPGRAQVSVRDTALQRNPDAAVPATYLLSSIYTEIYLCVHF